MSGRQLRWLGGGLLASAGAGLLALTSIMNPAFTRGDTGAPVGIDPPDGDDNVLYVEVMGGSGNPIPSESFNGNYLQDVLTNFLTPNFPSVTSLDNVNGLVTPEGFYPLTGVKSLPLDTSVTQGQTILDQELQQDLQLLPAAGGAGRGGGGGGHFGGGGGGGGGHFGGGGFHGAEGDVAVFGYSQSAVISSLEMPQLQSEIQADIAAGTLAPSALSDVDFVLVGDPMNPNGGILERFDGLNLSALGVDFYGATPSDDFSTAIYTLEYDGYADFPKYPIDVLADINAFLGIQSIHGTYPILTQQEYDSAILLPGSEDATTDPCADCLTNYFMIPQDPPLVSLVGDIPVIGGPLKDLLGPDLTLLINLGYGPDDVGYSTPADVPTTLGLFPDIDPSTFFNELVSDTQQGITNFVADLMGTGPNPLSLAALADPVSAVSAAAGDPLSFTDIVNAFSSAASTAYSTLLPTADIINSILTTVPGYDVSLFVDNLQNGDILDAIGLPIAADIGLLAMAAGVEYDVISGAVYGIVSDFSSLF